MTKVGVRIQGQTKSFFCYLFNPFSCSLILNPVQKCIQIVERVFIKGWNAITEEDDTWQIHAKLLCGLLANNFGNANIESITLLLHFHSVHHFIVFMLHKKCEKCS